MWITDINTPYALLTLTKPLCVSNTLTWLLPIWFRSYENDSVYLGTITPHYQNSSGVCNAILAHFLK